MADHTTAREAHQDLAASLFVRVAFLRPTQGYGSRPSSRGTGPIAWILKWSGGFVRPGVAQAVRTFVSSGTVSAVSVSGAASGKPAAGCIVSALKRAKVGPFQRSSYSVGVTIRP